MKERDKEAKKFKVKYEKNESGHKKTDEEAIKAVKRADKVKATADRDAMSSNILKNREAKNAKLKVTLHNFNAEFWDIEAIRKKSWRVIRIRRNTTKRLKICEQLQIEL